MKIEKVQARKISGLDRVEGHYTWLVHCPECYREIVFTLDEREEPGFSCECPFCWNPKKDKSAYLFKVKFE